MNFSKVIHLTNRLIHFAQSIYRVRFCITNQGEISSVGQSGRWSREHGENGICDETRSIRKLLLLRPSKKLSAKRILPLFEAVKVGIDAVLVIFCIFRFEACSHQSNYQGHKKDWFDHDGHFLSPMAFKRWTKVGYTCGWAGTIFEVT